METNEVNTVGLGHKIMVTGIVGTVGNLKGVGERASEALDSGRGTYLDLQQLGFGAVGGGVCAVRYAISLTYLQLDTGVIIQSSAGLPKS